MTESKKIKISFLSIVFLCVSFCVRAETTDLKTYNQALETCWQKWDTKAAVSDAEILGIINQTENCMKNVGYSLINRFYAKNHTQMKQNFDAFILATNQIEKDMYTRSDLGFQNYTSIKEVSAASSSLHLIKKVIKDMIACISWDLDDK